MADKKKMSVADILAAARKTDRGDAAEGASAEAALSPSVASDALPATAASADATAADATPQASPASGTKPAPVARPGAAGRPQVGDILAMARAGKSAAGGAPPAAEAPPAPPAAKKSPTVADKPAAAAKASPAAGVKAGKEGASAKAASAAGPRDTASILAAARKKDKPGPMTKSEAAAKETASPAPPARLTAPPMPTKPAYAQQPSVAAQPRTTSVAAQPRTTSVAAQPRTKGEPDVERRNFLWIGFSALGAVSALWSLAVVKFLFPNVLREPPSKFKVGFPDAFPPGKVDERFKAQYGVWIVNAEYNGQPQLVALKTVCTHLGCTPNWLEAEQKYKCPCHGSGFYKDGINFEGPAPRPLERYAIRIADDGQIEVDKSKTFQEEMGQWSDPLSFIMV